MKIETRAYILVTLILLQSFAIMILMNKQILNMTGNSATYYEYPYYMGIFLNFIGMGAIFSVDQILKVLKIERESIVKFRHSQEMIYALQGQKHDFKNHLNVIAGLLQLDKKENALEYIYGVSERVDSAFSVSKIENIEIAATLCRKCTIAENKGISIDLDISTTLENLDIDCIEISKVLFNLMDNAIYELEKSREEEKILTVHIGEQEDMYSILIGNSYPVLAPELYEKIFEVKFSTKGGEERGYGLHIVKQIIEKNKGKITVESYESIGTIFTVFLPMGKKVSMH